MIEKYSALRQEFLSQAEPFIDSKALDELKLNYMHNIDSKRKLSKVTDLQTLIRLLEKRDIVSCDKIEPLRYITKTFVGDLNLENKLHDYENWLKTMPTLHLCNMYQSDEVFHSISSISESPSSSNLSQSTIGRSTESFSQTQTHCCLEQEERNSLNERRKLLQQTVLLQLKDRLGRSWRDVARHLDIRECEIDAVQSKYPFDLKEQSHEILRIYISQSDTERWAINLIRALEKGRRKDLKELVEELVLKNKNL
ncbi:fas-associated death domain protein isoform X1 [Cataglyphis hispanica]|uniref:fas-associated death domain protein isoform X1 n=1 Tax=Cataglyphis hispanica TaxID=1086592 RepID=UPI002180850D|nr:fas-associated death domain protein isoform X1 [Cataglyphis hispanica]